MDVTCFVNVVFQNSFVTYLNNILASFINFIQTYEIARAEIYHISFNKNILTREMLRGTCFIV